MSNELRPPKVAAWVKKTKRGDDYLSIKLKDGTYVNLFKNRYKDTDRKPDFVEITKKDEQSSQNNESDFTFNSDIPF